LAPKLIQTNFCKYYETIFGPGYGRVPFISYECCEFQ
jgi:hypothetical protein